MRKKIIIGSRGSKLALLYAQQAKDKIIENTDLGNEDILIKSITTKGDEVQDIRLSELGGKGLFSSNIEKELQLKNIDIAVHALKDMPANETEGLRTDSFLERNDPREILITKNKKKLKDLDQKSIVGTSSYRREFQIKKIRPDLIHHNPDHFKNRYTVQRYDLPGKTVVSHLYKDGNLFIHPDYKQERTFTVREAARIQSFQDNFIFLGSRTEQYKQVGNAVPPLMAYKLAKVIRKYCG